MAVLKLLGMTGMTFSNSDLSRNNHVAYV